MCLSCRVRSCPKTADFYETSDENEKVETIWQEEDKTRRLINGGIADLVRRDAFYHRRERERLGIITILLALPLRLFTIIITVLIIIQNIIIQ